jgi:hypothetical protein
MRHTAIAIITLLLATFAALAYLAAAAKSPTYDEPLHALGAWQHLHQHDFRVNPEDPPLWHYWAALPNGPAAIRADVSSQLYRDVATDIAEQWHYTVQTLYRTEGNDGDTFILRSRVMMLIVAIALGVVIAWFAWQLAGPVAAVVATALYGLDPNFLGHAALVKNDVALSLVTLALAWAIWRAGRRVTVMNVIAISLLCVAALTVKFSGLLLGPVAAILLLARAGMKKPWNCFGREVTTRGRQFKLAARVCFAAAVVSYVGVWACYGFRYRATPDPAINLNMPRLLAYTAIAEATAKQNRVPTTIQTDSWTPPWAVRVIVRLHELHALPQAWLFGLLHTYQGALARPTFLNGRLSQTGWWYYFPATMAYKSSLTLIAASLAAAIFAIKTLRRRNFDFEKTWQSLCLSLPPMLYLLVAMKSNLNLGLRHVLPVYPFLFIAIGIVATRLYARRAVLTNRILLILLLPLLAEALLTFPNYIAFFNAASGGPRGGIKLLSDSNLDWGQDLKLLAEWRQKNPRGRLHLSYFGTADPWAYGIENYINFPGGYKFGAEYRLSNETGVLAVSATMLQGVYQTNEFRQIYDVVRTLEPFEVLGGTIYLYHWPPPVALRERTTALY